jgi:hypothetical protein
MYGANRSLLNLLEYLGERYEVVCIVPSIGLFTRILFENNIAY